MLSTLKLFVLAGLYALLIIIGAVAGHYTAVDITREEALIIALSIFVCIDSARNDLRG